MANVARIAGVEFGMATAKLLEGTLAAPATEVAADLAALRSGAHTAESLLAHCLDGADEADQATWEDYVDTVVAAAATRVGLFFIAPETEPTDAFAAGWDGNKFATEAEATSAIVALADATETSREYWTVSQY